MCVEVPHAYPAEPCGMFWEVPKRCGSERDPHGRLHGKPIDTIHIAQHGECTPPAC
jgi:hypothetical protein